MSGRSALPAALATLIALAACAPSAAQPSAAGESREQWVATCEDWADWDKPGPPFRIHGGTYYVGTCGISAVLIVDGESMVLIDSGTEAGAEHVLANIRALGFDPADVDLLLFSHEHFDHVGGMARLAAATGAELVVNRASRDVFATGRQDPGDPQFGMHEPMAPVQPLRVLGEGEDVVVGDLVLRPLATPGHTAGATSWHWRACDADRCLNLAYADSLSPVSSDTYRFSDHPAYVEAYRKGIARLAALECDIVLTPHPSASRLRDRLAGTVPLVDPAGCRAYAADVAARLDQRLREEAGAE